MLTDGRELHVTVIQGLSKDAKIRGASWDAEMGMVILLVEDPQIPEDDDAEFVNVVMKDVTSSTLGFHQPVERPEGNPV